MRRLLPSLLSGVLILVAGASAAVARQATPAATPSAAGPLPAVVWHLAEAMPADGSVLSPDDPTRYTIQFLPDGRLAARADCNSVGGSYAVDGPSLSLSNLMMTLVGCPPGSLGDDFAGWLESVVGYELADDGLRLSLQDGGILRFVPALTGVIWEWHQFRGGNDAVMTPERPEDYTLQFEPDGRVVVGADCNRGSGQYVLEGPEIDIERIGLTRKACPPESLSGDFVAHLEDVSSFVLAGGELALALPMDAGVLQFTARAVSDSATPVPATPTSG